MAFDGYMPNVPRPPNLIIANRLNGRLKVVMHGASFLITIVCEGFVGKSGILKVIL